jgi:catechol-2,3-dioxygenase
MTLRRIAGSVSAERRRGGRITCRWLPGKKGCAGDLERALAFYRGVLGLNVSRDEGSTLIPSLVAVSAGGYHHHGNLNTWAGERAARDSDRVAGLSGWELRVPDGKARAALVERVRAAGSLVPSSNGTMARDPDGVAIEIAGSG